MAFTIPNESAALTPKQAEPDKGDIDILVAGIGGAGVVSGCAVTAQATPDMTLAVASGTIRNADGTTASVSAANVTITAADATNPRFDLVVASSAGALSVTAGTAAAAPVYPAIPANSIVLAAVYVPAGDTAIESNQITDKRVLLTALGSSTPLVESGAGSAGTSALASRQDHVHPAAGGSLSYQQAALSADVSITAANTFYDGPSVSLAAGTWLVGGQVAVLSSTANDRYTAKLWDGTTNYASAQSIGAVASTTIPFTLALTPMVIVLAGTATVKISVATVGGSATIKSAVTDNSAGNTASYIAAVKIA